MKKILLPALCSLLAFFSCPWTSQAQDYPILGEIKISPITFIPKGWLECNGQILSIAQNQALFSLLGTTYGGNGQTTFALPDLRGRIAIGSGIDPSGITYVKGSVEGTESTTLSPNNLPLHNHTLKVYNGPGDTNIAAGNSLATGQTLDLNEVDASYSTAAPTTPLSLQTVSSPTSGTPIDNRQPYITLSYIICTSGMYPNYN